MKITTDIYRQIDALLSEVDFDRIHTVMKSLNWTWKSSDNQVPEPLSIAIVARGLLYDAVENGSASTGGLYAECIEEEDNKAELSLKFCIEDVYNETLEECDE